MEDAGRGGKRKNTWTGTTIDKAAEPGPFIRPLSTLGIVSRDEVLWAVGWDLRVVVVALGGGVDEEHELEW